MFLSGLYDIMTPAKALELPQTNSNRISKKTDRQHCESFLLIHLIPFLIFFSSTHTHTQN